jgi:D-alanyl-D-alanine carboxypeptidase
MSAPRTARLQTLLQRLLSQKHVMHALAAVESFDSSFRWIGAAGEATPAGAPMQPDTPFFIASIDKLFIAATIFKLYEKGRVALDEPMLTYLPDALVGGMHRLGGSDYTKKITIRNLLAHTSGLPDHLEDRPKGGRSLVETLVEHGDRSWSLEESIALVRDRLKPFFPPQTAGSARHKARYSDTNYMLLRAVIEAVTGRPLHGVYEEMLFRPLGLRHTWVAGHSQPHEPTSEPATLWFQSQPLDIPRALAALRSIFSTADDTFRFLRALVAGAIFEDPATVLLMQEKWNRFGLPLDRAALRGPNWPIEYALGMMRFRLPRILTPLRPMPPVVGHSGSTGTWLFYCPELNLLLSGTVDQVTAGAVPYRLIPKLLRVFQ